MAGQRKRASQYAEAPAGRHAIGPLQFRRRGWVGGSEILLRDWLAVGTGFGIGDQR